MELKLSDIKNLSNQAIEKQPRIDTGLLSLLQAQIKNELISSQMYYCMAAWLDDYGYNNVAKGFLAYGKEELEHMHKIYEFLFDRNCKVLAIDCPKQPVEYATCREIFEKALGHEIEVTKNWENIAKKAKELNDSTTLFFSEWYLKEQIEEENKMRDVLDKLNIGTPMWMIEQSFSK